MWVWLTFHCCCGKNFLTFTLLQLTWRSTRTYVCGVQNNALGIKHLKSRLGWWNKKLDFMQLSLVLAKYVSNQDKSFSFQIFWYNHKKSSKAFYKSFSWIRSPVSTVLWGVIFQHWMADYVRDLKKFLLCQAESLPFSCYRIKKKSPLLSSSFYTVH